MPAFQKTCYLCLGSFSILNVQNFPSSSDSEEFTVYGNESIRILKDHCQDNENTARNQWDDFRFEMILIRGKWFEFKRNIESSKLKMKQTATEWSLRYIVNNYQGQEFCLIIKYAKIAITVPVTNAWPERRANSVKRIKSRLRSTMKIDLLNALLMISMNVPTNYSKEALLIIKKATERYQSSKRRQIPGLTKVVKEKVKNVSVQTIDIINNNLIEAVSGIKNKLNHETDNLTVMSKLNLIQQVMNLMMALMTIALMKVILMNS